MAPPLLSFSEPEPIAYDENDRDPKKRRKISNRESARRSRMRKQQHLQEVLRNIDVLKRRNREMSAQLAEVEQKRAEIQAEIDIVNLEKAELELKLGRLMEVVKSAEERIKSGMMQSGGVEAAVDDPLLRPWQQASSASGSSSKSLFGRSMAITFEI